MTTAPDMKEATRAGRGGRPCPICGHGESAPVFRKDGFDVVRCAACDLVFVANPPGPDELRRLYSFAEGYHRGLVDGKAETTALTKAAHRHLADLLRYKKSGRLLDVGCSAGLFLDAARQAGWEVEGIELSSDTAAIARERYGLKVKTGTLSPGVFPAKSFDAVTLWDVIEHVPDPLSVLAVVRETLKDDGVLLLETPNIDGLFPALSYRVAAALDYWPHPEPPEHLFQFSKATIRDVAEKAAFRVIAIEDRRIPLAYSFGVPATLIRSPKRLAYALVFAPIAGIGPMLRSGDSLVLAATKATHP